MLVAELIPELSKAKNVLSITVCRNFPRFAAGIASCRNASDGVLRMKYTHTPDEMTWYLESVTSSYKVQMKTITRMVSLPSRVSAVNHSLFIFMVMCTKWLVVLHLWALEAYRLTSVTTNYSESFNWRPEADSGMVRSTY